MPALLLVFVRFVAERFERRMEQSADQAIERALDLVAVAIVKLGQFLHQPLNFFVFGSSPIGL